MTTLREYVQQAKCDYINAALAQSGGCVKDAAEIANAERTVFFKLIRRLGIKVIREGGKRYGNRGNEKWRALAEGRLLFDQRLSQVRRERLTSMSGKWPHE